MTVELLSPLANTTGTVTALETLTTVMIWFEAIYSFLAFFICCNLLISAEGNSLQKIKTRKRETYPRK